LRLRNLDNHFARLGEAKFIAGNLLNLARIALQIFDFVCELYIFLVELIDVGFHFLDFLLCAPHRKVAVRPENVVDHESQEQKAQQRRAVLAQKGRYAFVRFHFFQLCSTHFFASLVNFAAAAALSAST